eukprot:792150-Amphidinium_carterae.1
MEWQEAMWYKRFLRNYIVEGKDGKVGLPPTATADLAGVCIRADGKVPLASAIKVQCIFAWIV